MKQGNNIGQASTAAAIENIGHNPSAAGHYGFYGGNKYLQTIKDKIEDEKEGIKNINKKIASCLFHMRRCEAAREKANIQLEGLQSYAPIAGQKYGIRSTLPRAIRKSEAKLKTINLEIESVQIAISNHQDKIIRLQEELKKLEGMVIR